MSDAASKPDNSPVAGETGRILREAREAKGLSIREVADSLHLRPSIVSAIEEGDYRQVPGELFLRGYVKSYARHLSLDEVPLLASLDDEIVVFHDADNRGHSEHPLEQIERTKGRRRKWARNLVVILFLVAAGVVFMEFSGRTHLFLPGATQPAPTSQPAPASEPPPPAPAKPSPEATNSTAEASPAATPAAGTPAVQPPDQTAETAASGQKVGVGAAKEQAAATPPASSPAVTSQAPPVASITSDKPAADAVSGKSEPAPGPVDTLTMTFAGDCWVEVTNGEGNRVVAALKRSGDTVHYAGVGPLTVILGAVDQVSSLSFNGKTMDLSKYPAPGHRAEFVLGK